MSPLRSTISLSIFVCQILSGNSIRISYTTTGVQCMSVCNPDDSNRNYCYTNWHHWDYCTPGTGPDIQYYTTQSQGKKPECISHCGKFGEDYNWCWTAWKEWDKCTTKLSAVGYSTNTDDPCIAPCERAKNMNPRHPEDIGPYFCYRPHTVHEEMHLCAPSPLNLSLFDEVERVILASPGEYAELYNGDFKYRTVEHCHSRSKRINENVVSGIGVDQLAGWYETTFAANLVRRTDPNSPLDLNGPVESFLTRPSVPIAGLANIDLPLVIRARIYPRHRTVRTPIPGWVAAQMHNMGRIDGDEQGHLLAASVSGPNLPFNFCPQTDWLNRREQRNWTPSWWNMELNIRQFLERPNAAATDYIEWILVVAYGNVAQSRRPVGFAVRFTFNTNAGVERDSGTMTFNNHPDGC